MRENPTYQDCLHFIHLCGIEFNSTYSTGFNQWPLKQDLYRLQAQVNNALERAPEFSGEQEWLEEFKTQQAFDKLSK